MFGIGIIGIAYTLLQTIAFVMFRIVMENDKGILFELYGDKVFHKIFIIFLIVLVFLLISSYFISFFHGTVGYLRLSLRASFKRKENKEIEKNITHLQLKTTA